MQGSAPSAPSPGEIINQTISGTRKLGPAIGQINLEGNRQGISQIMGYLDSDGRTYTLDPARYDELNKIISKATKPLKSTEDKLTKAQSSLASAEAKLAAAQANPNIKPGTLAKLQKTVENAKSRTSALQAQVNNFKTTISNARTALKTEGPSVTDTLRAADSQTYGAIDRAGEFAGKIGQITPEGQRYLNALGQGYTPGTIAAERIAGPTAYSPDQIAAQQIQAARIGDFGRANAVNAANVANISAGQVGMGQLGGNLMQQALQRSLSDGSLNAQGTRDAIQSARQGFAARGLATGNSALAAELLNRDRYARTRQFEDLQFAGGVQAQDLDRQFQNVGNQLAADRSNQETAARISLANQQAAMQAEIANLDARQRAAVAQGEFDQAAALANQRASLEAAANNQAANQRANEFLQSETTRIGMANQSANLQGQVYNETARLAGAQQNVSQLGAASNFIDAQNTAGMNTQLGMANVYTQSNPLLRMLGLGTTFNTQGLGTQSAGAAADIVSGANAANMQLQGSNKAGMWSAIGSIGGAAVGTLIAPGVGTSIGAGIGGGIGGAAACWVARAAWGEDNPRWVEFRGSMLTHAPEWFIRFYCRFGPAIARHIHTPARRALARLILATLQHLWTPANPKLQPA